MECHRHHHGHFYERVESPRLALFAASCAAVVAGILVVLKAWAWFATNAVSMQASLLDSTVDCFSSVCAILAVRLSQRPAHPPYSFGFGKIEPLVALGQAALVVGSALFLLTESLHRLFSPEPIENLPIGLGVSAAALVLTSLLVGVQHYVIRRTHSVIIRGDTLHYQVDLLTNVGIIASLACSHWFGISLVDSLFGLGAAVYVTWGAVGLVRQSVGDLMDKGLSEQETAHFQRLLEEQPGVTRVTELKTRKSGSTLFLTACIEVDGSTASEVLSVLHHAQDSLRKHEHRVEPLLSLAAPTETPP
ncbi:MAG: cation diffusion facilitator family transporter [Holosporales bacterium]|nr:cation diffusion facilitator family transporter [Holosporales bacterium]